MNLMTAGWWVRFVQKPIGTGVRGRGRCEASDRGGHSVVDHVYDRNLAGSRLSPLP